MTLPRRTLGRKGRGGGGRKPEASAVAGTRPSPSLEVCSVGVPAGLFSVCSGCTAMPSAQSVVSVSRMVLPTLCLVGKKGVGGRGGGVHAPVSLCGTTVYACQSFPHRLPIYLLALFLCLGHLDSRRTQVLSRWGGNFAALASSPSSFLQHTTCFQPQGLCITAASASRAFFPYSFSVIQI